MKTIARSFIAGVFISIGCIINVKVGGLIGAVLFAFGLASVLGGGYMLYTGMAGDVRSVRDVTKLIVVIIGNILGTAVVSLWAKCAYLEVGFYDSAQRIVESRLDNGVVQALILSVLCGVVMASAVRGYRKGSNAQMVLGVPLFILAGFFHCIADSFYILSAPLNYLIENSTDILIYYSTVVLGNFIGCNLHRIAIDK